MAVPDYVVVFDEAMRAWVIDEDPPLDEFDAVDDWLTSLENDGPPPVVAHSVTGLRIAEGPHGVRIHFDVIAAPLGLEPPYGIVAVKRIRSSGR